MTVRPSWSAIHDRSPDPKPTPGTPPQIAEVLMLHDIWGDPCLRECYMTCGESRYRFFTPPHGRRHQRPLTHTVQAQLKAATVFLFCPLLLIPN